MDGFRAFRAPGSGLIALACVAMVGAVSVRAHAEPAAAGGPALRQARAAWERGSIETAEPLYREALEKGGLAPNEVLEGYVRLGAIRASLGKKDQAVAAFRAASVLDASFAVPSEAGPKGPALADKARKDTAKIGSIQLTIQAPKETTAGKPFTVTATLDKGHLPIVSKIGALAKDGTTGKEASVEASPEEKTELEIPSDVTLPGAMIVVRVDALDGHQNRLASAEGRVRVPDSGAPAAVAKGSDSSSAGASASAGIVTPPGGDPGVRKGGSFWSTPWPYVIGALALAGAGTAVYFGTRPPDDVSVGQVGVRTR